MALCAHISLQWRPDAQVGALRTHILALCALKVGALTHYRRALNTKGAIFLRHPILAAILEIGEAGQYNVEDAIARIGTKRRVSTTSSRTLSPTSWTWSSTCPS